MAALASWSFDLDAYLERIGLAVDSTRSKGPSLEVLTEVMAAQTRAIAFENLDVVLETMVSIQPEDVERKLVRRKRGGYCFEQNTLLQLALAALHFPKVQPLLCRVRWGKRPDEVTPYTHMALRVRVDAGPAGFEAGDYLVDVGFAGTNSIRPLRMGDDAEQRMVDGVFRLRTGDAPGFTTCSLRTAASSSDGGSWRDLYTFCAGADTALADLEQANWWSCTKPGARFTGQFFVSRTGESGDKHHILNGDYVVRRRRLPGNNDEADDDEGASVFEAPESTMIRGKEHLLELLTTTFGIEPPAGDDGSKTIDRYLTPAL